MARSGATNSEKQSILRYLFGSNSFTPPANYYIGVSTTAINDDGTGATEPVDVNYARIQVTNNNASWEDIPLEFGRRNLIDLEWSPATISWGTVTYMFIASEATGLNLKYYAELTIPKVIGIDDILRIPATELTINILPTT